MQAHDMLYGFGYDSVTDDYKVVAVCRHDKKVKIYSLNTGIWKKAGDFPDVVLWDDAMFFNGSLYWVDCTSSSKPNILSFDLHREAYTQVLRPPFDEGDRRLYLGVLGDRLCVLDSREQTRVTDLWVRQDSGMDESWSKLASIPHPDWAGGWGRYWQVYWMSNDGNILVQFGLRVVLYDTINSALVVLGDIEECQFICSFDESLVSPLGPGIRYRLRSSRGKSRMGETSSRNM